MRQHNSERGWGGTRNRAGRKRIVQEPDRIAVDLEKPDLDTLRDIAADRGTSVAQLVRRAVSQFIRRTRRE
jgi:predicted DNA-binding ribbon-helix-helix protein